MLKLSKKIFSILIILPLSFHLYGSEPEMNIVTNIEKQFLLNTFDLINTENGLMDGEKVITHRYQKSSPIHYFGEHISFVFSSDNKLKGLTRMSKEFELVNNELPTKDKAKEVALDFISSYAGDLLKNMEIKWIKPHDETVKIGDISHIVSGMKVKCRNLDDGKYFWVIVGKDNNVIVFERDIIWNFIKGGRQTEKWLHDGWLSSMFNIEA